MMFPAVCLGVLSLWLVTAPAVWLVARKCKICEPGQIGDAFGAFNALFSALAFLVLYKQLRAQHLELAHMQARHEREDRKERFRARPLFRLYLDDEQGSLGELNRRRIYRLRHSGGVAIDVECILKGPNSVRMSRLGFPEAYDGDHLDPVTVTWNVIDEVNGDVEPNSYMETVFLSLRYKTLADESCETRFTLLSPFSDLLTRPGEEIKREVIYLDDAAPRQ